MTWNTKHRRTNKFVTTRINSVIRCGDYGQVVYNILIEYKPIVSNKCKIRLTSLDGSESMTCLVNLSYGRVIYRINDLYKEYSKEIEDTLKNRKRRILRVERMLKRNNKVL